MPNRPRGFNRNVTAGLALSCAAAACAIVIAAGGCGDDDLVFPGGTPPATGTVATQTVGTATPTVHGTTTMTPTATPGGTTTPTCRQPLAACTANIQCCSGTCVPALVCL